MTPKAVIGLGFGDEGKGRVVDWLCSKAKSVPRVVRFSGGHQAAHHVVHESRNSDELDHVFAHFGSGTLRGASTYWSHFCPVSPTALLNEYAILREKCKYGGNIHPTLVIDRSAPLTTPWEKTWNLNANDPRQHGSCGVGIYATHKREEQGHRLHFEDIYHPQVLGGKLALLCWAPMYQEYRAIPSREDLEQFLADCATIADMSNIRLGNSLHEFETVPFLPIPGAQLIFEGSQGLMLDAKYGFFPHVTPSRTGTHNLREMRLHGFDLWLVTRAYATRHGNGPFVPFEGEMKLKPNKWEQNKDGGMQGKFRTGPLSLDLLRYAVNKDPYIRNHLEDATLVITCVDQLEDDCLIVTEGGKRSNFSNKQDMLNAIANAVGAKRVLISNTAYGDWPLLGLRDI